MATFPCVAWSGTVESDSEQLNYRGKILTLRQPRMGNRLSFTYDRHLVGKAEECPWTVCAQIEVKEIRVDGRTLRILSRRLLLFFDPTRKELRDAFSAGEKEEVAKHFGHPEPARKLNFH
jgi:hypothetical protein